MKINKIFVSDFETTVRENFACVWLYASVNIDNLSEIYHGTSIDQYMDNLFDISPDITYFHNLKYDGMYIIDWALRNGFTYTEEGKIKPTEFKMLMGDEGALYSITFNNGEKNIQIWDSLKIFNFTVEEIANSFKLELTKGEIDYNAYRPEGYVPTDIEIDYVDRDVLIVAKAIKMFRDDGHAKMTIASNALAEFKSTIDKKDWKYLFPQLDYSCDDFCRKSYKGGFTYVNPKYQNKVVGKGCVYDMNSMYPYTLYYKQMPVGTPQFFVGKPPENKLYIIQIHVDKFKLKRDHIPTLQIKGSFRFCGTDYLTDGEDVDLYLTSIDYKLFKDHYITENITEMCGYSFESRDDLFRNYIDKFMKIKMNTKGGQRAIAKLFLNGLYGKFGSKIDKISKIPYLDNETNTVKFKRTPPKQTDPIYIPVASFVTAYARDNIIRNAQKIYDRFIYCDTDSLHVLSWDVPDIPIDNTKLGYYKCEGYFKKAIFIRPKTYTEITKHEKTYYKIKCNHKVKIGKLRSIMWLDDIKCAGMSKNIVKSGAVKFENFREGNSFDGKLKPKMIPGGVILIDTPFTIKDR